MSLEQTLMQRSDSACELCGEGNNLDVYKIPPTPDDSPEQALLICNTCQDQIDAPDTMDANHWRCLNDAMWKPVDAIQVMSWRLLSRLSAKGEAWAQDLVEMMYLEEDALEWAKSTESDGEAISSEQKDSNVLVSLLNVARW